MNGVIGVGLAVLFISIIMSTKEQRAEARARMRPIGKALTVPAALLWGWLLWVWLGLPS